MTRSSNLSRGGHDGPVPSAPRNAYTFCVRVSIRLGSPTRDLFEILALQAIEPVAATLKRVGGQADPRRPLAGEHVFPVDVVPAAPRVRETGETVRAPRRNAGRDSGIRAQRRAQDIATPDGGPAIRMRLAPDAHGVCDIRQGLFGV